MCAGRAAPFCATGPPISTTSALDWLSAARMSTRLFCRGILGAQTGRKAGAAQGDATIPADEHRRGKKGAAKGSGSPTSSVTIDRVLDLQDVGLMTHGEFNAALVMGSASTV